MIVIEYTVDGLPGIGSALTASEIKGAAILLALVVGEIAIDNAVVGEALDEGGPVKNRAAVAAGYIIDETGVADHIVGFCIGAGKHPDGATAAELPNRFIVFEQATVDAQCGKAASQQISAGYVECQGAAIVAGVVVAKGTTDKLRFDHRSDGAGYKYGRSPADRLQGAGIAFESTVAYECPDGSIAASIHADTATAGGVVVAEDAILNGRAALFTPCAIDVEATSEREAKRAICIAVFNNKPIDQGFGSDIFQKDDPKGIIGTVILSADIPA